MIPKQLWNPNFRFCRICNEKFLVNRIYFRQTCSQKCFGRLKSIQNSGVLNGSWKGGDLIKICFLCGSEFKIKRAHIIYRKFCSKKCRNLNDSIKYKGINNPFYNKKHNVETIKKIFNSVNRRPTTYEIRIKVILEKLYPNEWVYTGNGKLWIGYPPKNPDFIHRNKNLIIEVYSIYFKILNFGSENKYILYRYHSFLKNGFKTIFFNENEINEQTIFWKIEHEK